MPPSKQELNSRFSESQNVQLDLGVFVKDFSGWRNVETFGQVGGLYQPCSPEEYECRVEVVRSKIENGCMAELRVSEFQDWAELDWMRPQGTFEAGKKLGEKLVEEAQEYYKEITHMESRAHRKEPNRNTQPGILEAGDYLWMLMATSSNSGVDLEDSLRAKFQVNKPVTLGDLHDLTKHGFNWMPLRIENPTEVSTADSDTGGLDPYTWLCLQPVELYRYMYHLYGKEDQIQKPNEAPDELRMQAADWQADALLFLAYYIQHWTYSSLPEVASMNFEKVTERVKHGTVDKLNGGR